jgi:ADP-heptose:LPS heptosyltransferase
MSLRAVDRSVVFAASGLTRRWVRFLTGSKMRSGGSKPLGEWEECLGFDTWAFAGRSYAEIAGVDPTDFRPLFPLRPREESYAENRLEPGRSWVAVAPGGAHNPRDTVVQKRWPEKRFAEVVDRLTESGHSVVLIGGDGDVPAAAEVAALSKVAPLDLTGSTDWGQTAALISRCRGFLGIDTGTAHLAVAMGKRPVVLFGPTNPESLYPPGTIVPVETDAECAPCYSNSVFPGCPRGRSDCMERISADRVWSVLKEELDAHSGP